MKKLSFLLIAALVMAACSNNDELPNTENLNGKVTVTATFAGNASDSRVALMEDATNPAAPTIKVTWEEEESFSVIRGTENKTYSKHTAGNAFTGDAHATTTGNYYAFYPVTTATETNALPYNLSTQTGELDEAKTYMYAKNESEGKDYEFTHLTALVKFTLNLPSDVTGVTPKKVVISSDKLQPVGTVNLTGDDVVYTPTANTATSVTITPTVGEESLAFYVYVTPMTVDIDNENTFVIHMDGSDGKFYSGTLETSVSIAANYLYTASVDMTAVVKGSLAMKDGSFMNMSADDIDALSDSEKIALKNEISGIVFWTEDEEGSATLASDKILKADFPDCTHGLIVSLTNVVTNSNWQTRYNSVAAWQNSNDTHKVGADGYRSIASLYANDDNIKDILGYQNTKLLKAYNNVYGDTDYKIILVEKLVEWTDDNPDIVNTTGWFIPSAKELYILCYQDVDNLTGYNADNTTRLTIDPLIAALGGTEVSTDPYWSSTEFVSDYGKAFQVGYSFGYLTPDFKGRALNARAVCAY